MQIRRISKLAVMLTALTAAGCATSSAVATGETLDVQLEVGDVQQTVEVYRHVCEREMSVQEASRWS